MPCIEQLEALGAAYIYIHIYRTRNPVLPASLSDYVRVSPPKNKRKKVPTAAFSKNPLLLPVFSSESPPCLPGCHWALKAESQCIIRFYSLEPTLHLDPATSCFIFPSFFSLFLFFFFLLFLFSLCCWQYPKVKLFRTNLAARAKQFI